MLDKFYIIQHVTALKLRAALKYNICPEKCHLGHVILQGLLDRPYSLNQIDAATDERETNISVAKRSCRLASAMRKYGIQPGDSVILMGNNHLDLVIPFYASYYNGYTTCAIDTSVAPEDICMLWANIKPKIIFCQKKCEEKVKEAFVVNNLQGEIVIFDDKDADLEAFIRQYKGTEINFRPAEFDQYTTNAWLMLTSGTTGLPKIAMIPYDTVLNGTCCWWETFTGKAEVYLTMATLQWLSSLFAFVAGPMRCFTRLQSSGPLTPQNLVTYINKYKPNVTAWTPYLLGQFVVAAQKGGCDLSCFNYIIIGGSSIEKPLLDKFRQLCPAILGLVYGMTELIVPIFDFNDDTPENSTGYPYEKYQLKLVDEDGNSVEKPYRAGELWVKGDDFFKGYMNNIEETRKILTKDGWLKTGDLFQRDEQNYYYFVERKRLLIKHFGYLISPLQLEEVIKRHPAVLEACVVGVPDPACMELPIAAIQLRNNSKLDPEEIFSLLRDALPDRKQLRGGIFYVDTYPTTPSGKVNRSKVRELALTSPRILPKLTPQIDK